MDSVHGFRPPFAATMRSGREVSTTHGAWLPWPRYRIDQDSDGWLIAEPGARSLWDSPFSSYALLGTKRRRERRPPPHIRFGSDATSLEGPLQFAREFGLPDLPPFHALADTFDAWGQAPGWQDLQRQAWSDLRGHGYDWNLLGLRLLGEGLHPGVLSHATVMVFGPWVQLVAGLQSSLNHLASLVAPEVNDALLAAMLAGSEGRRNEQRLLEASPAVELCLRDACHEVTRAMAALLEWAEPHWAVLREKQETRICLLPARLSDLRDALGHDTLKLGARGGAIDTHEGIWGWLRRLGLARFRQGGPLSPPYVGAVAERDQDAEPVGLWPQCAGLADFVGRFSLWERQMPYLRRLPDGGRHDSYLQHAVRVLRWFTVWDGPDNALPTLKPHLSLRHGMLGMVSRDAFGGWWVRCGDMEGCGGVLLAPSEGRWYHTACRQRRLSREAKRRARSKTRDC
jgi:hypothetical protein